MVLLTSRYQGNSTRKVRNTHGESMPDGADYVAGQIHEGRSFLHHFCFRQISASRQIRLQFIYYNALSSLRDSLKRKTKFDYILIRRTKTMDASAYDLSRNSRYFWVNSICILSFTLSRKRELWHCLTTVGWGLDYRVLGCSSWGQMCSVPLI